MSSTLEALKKFIITGSILFFLGYLANLFVDNPYAHRILRDLINRQLDEYTYVSVKFEAINLRFVPLSLDIYGVQVKQTSGNSTKNLLQTSHIRARLSILAILLNKPERIDLELNEPKVELPLPPLEGILRLDKFPELLTEKDKPVVWPPTWHLPFYRLSLQNFNLDYKIPGLQTTKPDILDARLEGIDLTLYFKSPTDYTASVHLRRGNLVVEGSHLLRDTDISCDLIMNNDHLTSSYFRINSTELTAQADFDMLFESTLASPKLGFFSGKTKILDALQIKMSHQIEQVDLAILGRYLDAEKTQGTLSGSLQTEVRIPLHGEPVTWQLKGQATAANSLLAGFKLLNSSSDFLITKEGINFHRIRLKNDQQEFGTGQGFLGFEKDVPFDFTLDTKAISFATLMSILQVEDFDAIQTKLDSRKITLKGQASPFEIKIGGQAEFKDITFPFVTRLPHTFLEPPGCILETELVINSDTVRINKAQGPCWLAGVDKGQAPQAHLSLGGKLGFTQAKGLALSIESRDLDGTLLNHFTKIPSQGQISSKILLKGPYNKIDLSGRIESTDVNFGGFPFTNLHTDFLLPLWDNKVIIQSLQASTKKGGILQLTHSSLQIQEPYHIDANIKVENLPPDFLPQGLEKIFGASGSELTLAQLTGKVQGPLLKPFEYQGNLSFILQNLSIHGEKIFTRTAGSFEGNPKYWQISDTIVQLDQIKARLDMKVDHSPSRGKNSDIFGKLGLGPKEQLHLNIRTLHQLTHQYSTNDLKNITNHLGSIPYIGSLFQSHNSGGEIHFEASFEGPYKDLQGQFKGSVERPFVWGIPISSIAISGFFANGNLNIPDIRHSGNALVGRLQVDFNKPNLPYEWYLYFNQTDIRALLGKTFADDPRNFAYLNAEWNMSGKLGDFWQSSGAFTLTRIRSKIFQNLGSRTSSFELNSDESIKLNIAPDRWKLAQNRPLKLKGEFFDLELSSGNNQLPNNLDLQIKGAIKLEILKNFSNFAETARGEVLLDGYLRGSIYEPDFSLRIQERKLDPFNLNQWNPLSLGLVDYGPAFSDVSLDIEIKKDKLVVHKFRANKGREGTLSAFGVLGFKPETAGISRLEIKLDRIEFNRMNIPILKTADLLLSGNLSISGSSRPFQLDGNLKIDRFQSIGNFDLRREIVTSLYESKITSGSAGSAGTAVNEFTPLFLLDIGLSADRSILIKNKTLEATLSSNLRVRGNDVLPLLLGQIIAERGSFNYRRQFKLQKAVISFDEPITPPNPRLDIIGEANVSPYQVQVLVNGDLANPRISLACDPPNREDGSMINNLDIFLLLSTGKIPEQANKTAGRASVNELFSSFLVFAEEPIEKLFDISGQTIIREVYIDSYLSETEQRPITRLNVPFNLWGFANAVVQVDDESNAKVSFEYPIHEGITFSGSVVDRKDDIQSNTQTNSAADTGFDLKFRFGFD